MEGRDPLGPRRVSEPGPRGLRRFVAPQRRALPPNLQHATRPAPQARPGEACEMCGEVLADDHPHVVDLDERGLLCVCRACYLLFTHEGAAGGRYRAVPDRYLYLPDFALDGSQWDALQIPVGVAFFFRNSRLGRVAAFYPSPGGATESLLDLEAWDDVTARHPALGDLAPDVEAVLLRHSEEGSECYIVPIDACYELVGIVRKHWKGFDGGAEARAAIDAFFGSLRDRCRVVEG